MPGLGDNGLAQEPSCRLSLCDGMQERLMEIPHYSERSWTYRINSTSFALGGLRFDSLLGLLPYPVLRGFLDVQSSSSGSLLGVAA